MDWLFGFCDVRHEALLPLKDPTQKRNCNWIAFLLTWLLRLRHSWIFFVVADGVPPARATSLNWPTVIGAAALSQPPSGSNPLTRRSIAVSDLYSTPHSRLAAAACTRLPFKHRCARVHASEKDHPNTQQGIFYMHFIGAEAAAPRLVQWNHPGWEVNHLPLPQCAAEVPLSNWPWDTNRTSPNPRQLQNYFWYQSSGTERERGGYIISGTFITDPGGSVIPAALSHVGCLLVDFGSSGPFLGMSCFNNSSAFVSRFWKPVWKYWNVCEAAGQTLFVWK